MHTVTTALALGIVSTIAATVPAAAAGTSQTADPAPANVQVAWTDDTHQAFRVTWDDVGQVANRAYAVFPNGTGHLKWAPADGPNQVDIPHDEFDGVPVVRIAVVVANSAGQTTSQEGFSVAFDTLKQPKPIIDSIKSVPPKSFTVKWHPQAPTEDPNPGDPLDLPVTPRYQVWAPPAVDVNYLEPVTPLSTATEATFELPASPPSAVSVTADTEWGPSYSATRYIDRGRFTSLTIPTTATYGQLTVIKGVVKRVTYTCDGGPCGELLRPGAPRTVVLQARANATSPWYVVGSTRSTSTDAFTISPPTWGTRQYRIVVPDVYTSEGLGLGVISGPVTTVAKPKVTASFADATVKYGQKVTARIGINPKANVRTTLQRWDGKAWRDLKWVNTSNGAGSYTFTTAKRGEVSYRFVVPALTWSGRPLASQVSPTFVLTTS
jgi:hypothetical protein